jgi:hypothetical protein
MDINPGIVLGVLIVTFVAATVILMAACSIYNSLAKAAAVPKP